ncbi:MAG: hypothetical protein QNI84_03185 [Henriciella sp.]|nr:hypothetical protein [Henriciella sp.]
MDIRFTLAAVQHLPVYLWPWVWWQLFAVKRWCRVNKRKVLWQADENGKVWVTFVSDDPKDLTAWCHQQNKLYRPHWYALYNESGEMHLSAIHFWMGRIMECGERLMYRAVSQAARTTPAIEDSS